MSKKLIYGKGFNSKGKHKTGTLAYTTWRGMFMRCYSENTRKKYPTYVGCTVDDSWLDFQDFADWFYDNPYSDMSYHLDKDLLIANNKVYGPETGCFVPQELNKLLADHGAARGQYPQGVSLRKSSSKYKAQIRINGKPEFLGYFDCPQEAHQVYTIAKEAYVKRKALEWQDRIASDVFDALMSWKLNC